jgi:hypothetical protein
MSEWGEDPNKWVIQKSAFSDGWMVYAPHDSGGALHASFNDAVAVAGGVGYLKKGGTE